mgnify:CR=1 FL=1
MERKEKNFQFKIHKFEKFKKNENIMTASQICPTKIVIIDAGHGGEDGGAVAGDGTVEKDINLKIALQIF